MNVHLATDHAGLELKEKIKLPLSLGHEVIDHGAYEYDALDDYPILFSVCYAVAKDKKYRYYPWWLWARRGNGRKSC